MIRKITFIVTLLSGLAISCSPPPADNANKLARTNDSLVSKGDSIAKSDSLKIKQLISDYDLSRADTFAVGDVNGDGKKDKAIIQPLTFFFHNNKIDSQYVNITFTCDLPAIKHYNGFSGLIANVGDLDGNKTEEIAYCPDWYQSNDAEFYIYGYRQNKWILFGMGAIRRDAIAEAKDPVLFLKSRVKKINNSSFKLTEHVWVDASIVDSTTTVMIK